MAFVPVPDDMGGDRAWIADPTQAGISTTVGDLAATMLQMQHLMRGVLAAGDGRAEFVALADRTRAILAASDASQAREKATRELSPMTRVPAPWGVNALIGNIRMHIVPIFSGTSADTLDVVRWLSRVFTLAQANTLTYAAAVNLLIQGSSGGAADYIEQMREEGKDLPEIVQLLEMRYGDLCTPEEARDKY